MARKRETRTVVTVDGRSFTLSNPDKVLIPAGGVAAGQGRAVTKLDLVEYYPRIADVMVPHLRGRPLMLARYPDGIDGPAFYQKDVSEYFPDWIRRVEVPTAGGTVVHPVCDDAATLAYLAGQASITPHAWLSRADRLHHPDRLVVDLDPSGSDLRAEFEVVRSAARLVRGDRRLGPERYAVHNVFRRLARRDDPWAEIDRHARPLAGARDRLDGLLTATR
jgi:bifunctional non-homologous end joining protein LigD